MQWQSAYWIVSKFLSPKRHNKGKTQWTIKSFKLQSSHIMILNTTKFGGNRTKDVEVGPDRRTDRQADSYIPPKLCLRGGIIKGLKINILFTIKEVLVDNPNFILSTRTVIFNKITSFLVQYKYINLIVYWDIWGSIVKSQNVFKPNFFFL